MITINHYREQQGHPKKRYHRRHGGLPIKEKKKSNLLQ